MEVCQWILCHILPVGSNELQITRLEPLQNAQDELEPLLAESVSEKTQDAPKGDPEQRLKVMSQAVWYRHPYHRSIVACLVRVCNELMRHKRECACSVL